MAQKLTASMPEGLDLESSWQIVFAAIDPTSGAPVSGVTFANACLQVEQLTPGGAEALAVGPFKLIPLDELNSG